MSETADQMAPDASPGAVSKKSGVRRVNNVPMYLLAGVLGLFLLVMALVAADRSAKQNARSVTGTKPALDELARVFSSLPAWCLGVQVLDFLGYEVDAVFRPAFLLELGG